MRYTIQLIESVELTIARVVEHSENLRQAASAYREMKEIPGVSHTHKNVAGLLSIAVLRRYLNIK